MRKKKSEKKRKEKKMRKKKCMCVLFSIIECVY